MKCHWCDGSIKPHSKIIGIFCGQYCNDKYLNDNICNITDKHYYHRDCYEAKEDDY